MAFELRASPRWRESPRCTSSAARVPSITRIRRGSSRARARNPCRTRSWKLASSLSKRSAATCPRRRRVRARPTSIGQSSTKVRSGSSSLTRHGFHGADGFERQLAAVGLIGERRVRESIAEHYLAGAKRGPNQLSTCCARSARMRNSSASPPSSWPSAIAASGSLRRAWFRPAHVSLARRASARSSAAARRPTCVVFPPPSIPSIVMNKVESGVFAGDQTHAVGEPLRGVNGLIM